MRYKAFISYKHASSREFAERLELAVKSYAKPLWRPPLAIFRDEKYLKPGLDLPQMIREALDESEYFIYLASPEAAQSSWIKDELSQWCADKGRRTRLIIVLTAGNIKIEETSKTVDWEYTNAIPIEMQTILTRVPLYIDCSSLTGAERQTLLDPDFKKTVNAIVATFRGLEPLEMSGQEILQHKKNLRNRNLLVTAAIAMLLAAAIGGSIAFQQNQRAASEARIAQASQLDSEALTAASAQLPQRALLLAVAAARLTSDQGEPVTAQAEQTLRDLLSVTGGYGVSGHTGAINQLFFLRHAGRLLSIGSDGQVILWRLDGEGGADAGIEVIAKRGRILSFTEQQELLKLVTEKGHVLMRSLGAAQPAVTEFDLPGFEDENETCATKPLPKAIMQISHEGALRTWRLDQAVAPIVQMIAQNPQSCEFSPDGQWLFLRDENRSSLLFHIGEGRAAPAIVLHNAKEEIAHMAFSPGGDRLAIAMSSGTTHVFTLDLHRLQVQRSFDIRMKKDQNLAVGFSRTGGLLAIGGEDGTIELWRTTGGPVMLEARTKVPFSFYRAIKGRFSFERQDTLLIASDGLRAAAAIPLQKGSRSPRAYVLHNHPGPNDIMGDLAAPYALHPSLPLLATAGFDHNVSLWSIEKGAITARNEPLRGHDGDILTLEFSPDGKWLATAGNDKVIRLWPVQPPQWQATPAILDSNSGNILLNEKVPNPQGGVQFAHFMHGSEWIESFGDGSSARIGRIDRMGRLREAITLPEDEKKGGSAGNDLVQLWSHSHATELQRKLLEELHHRELLDRPKEDAVFEVERSGGSLAEAVDEGVRFWNLSDPSSKPVIYRGLPGKIVSVCPDIQFGKLAAVSQTGQIAWWKIGQPQAPEFLGELTSVVAGAHPLVPGETINATQDLTDFEQAPEIMFAGDGNWIFLNFQYLLNLGPKSISAWRVSEKAHQTGLTGGCCLMQLFEDRFDLWLLAHRDTPMHMQPPAQVADVTAFDYNQSRRRLALGLRAGRIVMMEFDPNGFMRKSVNIASHDYIIRSVALSSDAGLVAAGSAGGITLTEVSGDLLVARHTLIKGHRGDVHFLRFSPDGKWLLSGGEDDSLHVSPVQASQLTGIACAVAGRKFSKTEQERLQQPWVAAKVCQ